MLSSPTRVTPADTWNVSAEKRCARLPGPTAAIERVSERHHCYPCGSNCTLPSETSSWSDEFQNVSSQALPLRTSLTLSFVRSPSCADLEKSRQHPKAYAIPTLNYEGAQVFGKAKAAHRQQR